MEQIHTKEKAAGAGVNIEATIVIARSKHEGGGRGEGWRKEEK